jgi:hypothetical protein
MTVESTRSRLITRYILLVSLRLLILFNRPLRPHIIVDERVFSSTDVRTEARSDGQPEFCGSSVRHAAFPKVIRLRWERTEGQTDKTDQTVTTADIHHLEQSRSVQPHAPDHKLRTLRSRKNVESCPTCHVQLAPRPWHGQVLPPCTAAKGCVSRGEAFGLAIHAAGHLLGPIRGGDLAPCRA